MPYVTLFELNPNLSTLSITWLWGNSPWILDETTTGCERCSVECAALGVIDEVNVDLLGTHNVRFWYEV